MRNSKDDICKFGFQDFKNSGKTRNKLDWNNSPIIFIAHRKSAK